MKIALWIVSIVGAISLALAIIFMVKYYKKSGKTLADIINELPVFADDAAAKTAGLKIGDSYKTADGAIKTIAA